MSKVSKGLLVVVLGFAMIGSLAPAAHGQTVAELQAQISALLAQIQALQAQLSSTGSGGTVSGSLYNWTRDLTLGSTGPDAKALQQFLNGQGYLVAQSGAGSAGNETEYFGSLTQAALAKFQAAKGISPAVGYFGPITRNYIATNYAGSGTGTGTVPSTGVLTAMVASNNPAAGTIADGSLYNPMLRVTFMGGATGGTITGLTVTRGGLIANTNISGVSVWDENGNRLGNIITALTAEGQATIDFGSNDIAVGAGQSRTLTVAANIDASAGSGTVSFSIASASDIQGATVSGSFPLSGNIMTVVDGSSSLADIWVDDQSVAGITYLTISSATGNVEVGDQQLEVGKFSFQQANSKEAVQLQSLTVYVEGTIQETTDVKNWKLYSQEGTVLASADAPVGRFVTFNLASPYVIDKGITKYLSVKADIMDGSSRYFRVSIQNDYDVKVMGVTTGAYIAPLDGTGTSFSSSDTQNITGGFKIKQGALTVTKASGSPSGNIAPGSNNVVLAKFDIKSSGETFEIRKMHIGVDYASGYSQLTGTVTVRDADTGTVYVSVSASTSGLQGASYGTGSYSSVLDQSLSSYLTVPSGQTKSIEVLGSVPSTATSSSNYTVLVGGFYGKRYSTNDYTTLPNETTLYGANQLSVNDVTLTVTKDASFGNTNRAAGATNVKVGQFVFQASSADDIRVTGINLTFSTSSNLQNVKLLVGGNQFGSTIGTPNDSSNSFSGNVTITKSTAVVVEVYADVISSAAGSSIANIAASGVSGYGINSSKAISSTPSSEEAGQTITIGTPAVTIKVDAGAPVSGIVLAGQSGVELSRISLEASNEDLSLKKITLSLATASSVWSATAATGLPANISKLYLYDGATSLGGVSLVNGLAVFSGLNLTLAQNTPKVLSVKADITPSGTLVSKSVGAVDVESNSNTYLEVYSSQGLMSSGSVTLTSNAQGNYMLFTDAAPTIANSFGSASATGNPSTTETIGKYTITNPGSRVLTLTKLYLRATLTGASSTDGYAQSFKLYDSSGSTLLATSTLYSSSDFTGVETKLTGATTTVYVLFDPVTYGAAAQEIAANGGSQTYVVKADTLNVETGLTSPGQTTVRLYTEISGDKGYVSTDLTDTDEALWNDGYVTYKYTPVNGSAVTGLTASDSVPVSGPVLSY